MARLTQADLSDLNESFEERTPLELIHWAQEMFGTRLAALSSMQRAGCVVAHMLSQLQSDLPILFVDTGVLFQETLDTRDRLIREYNLNIVTLTPEKTMQEQTEELGVLYLSVEGQEKCCDIRKTQPLMQVAEQYDALIGSLRRADGGQRANVPILAIDPAMNCLRVNILASLSKEEFQAYLKENQVITNPLHQQGYPTIGCNRCTTPVMESEPNRAGRWRHLGPWSQYCGINPTDVAGKHAPSIDLPQDLVDRILGRETDFMI
jgi:phosphoadenosine phosphosulfate reductase